MVTDTEITTYEIHVDLYSYVSLFIRIMQVDNPEERKVQLKQLHEVMLFLVVPTACYHKVIEEYFEWERATDKRDCMHYCSKCLKEVGGFTKRVNKEGLQSMLADKVHGSSKTIKEFVKIMKAQKGLIFHEGDVPGREMGQVHALCLQMIAKGMIELKVNDKTKVGTDKIARGDLSVSCPIVKRVRSGLTYCYESYRLDEMWEGINVYSPPSL